MLSKKIGFTSRYYEPLRILKNIFEAKNYFKLVFNDDKQSYHLPYLYGNYINQIDPIPLSNELVDAVKKYFVDNLYNAEEIKLLLCELLPEVDNFGKSTMEWLQNRGEGATQNESAYIHECRETAKNLGMVREIAHSELTKYYLELIPPIKKAEATEQSFLNLNFDPSSIDTLQLEPNIASIIKSRFLEIENCINAHANLAAIILIGSNLEGIMLGIANKYPKPFNQAKTAPKNLENKVKSYSEWNLNNFIDTCFELQLLQVDVKRYSHILRDFRNYIHPMAQLKSGFSPNHHTVTLSFQVLKIAVHQISTNIALISIPI